MYMKKKILNIFIRGLEKRCLSSQFPKILFSAGIGLLSINWLDMLASILNINQTSEIIQTIAGVTLIIISICLYISERKHNTIEEKPYSKRILDVSQSFWSVSRVKETLISSRSSLLMILFSLIVLVLMIGLVILNVMKFSNLSIWICLVIMVVVIKPIIRLLCMVYNLKKTKLIILNKKHNIEYGKDKNIYLTSYDFICPNCSQPTTGHLEWVKGNYLVVCSEYQNHNQILQINQFDKFSNP